MGHYLSEMQAEPIIEVRYKEWKKELQKLQQLISNLSMARAVACDVRDIIKVLDQKLDWIEIGSMYRPRYDIPHNGEEILTIAKRLVKKYHLKQKGD